MKPARPSRLNILAALDIGTNSIRLEVVRIEPDHSLSIISQQKETARLGESEFDSGKMTVAAIERGALVCARFVDVARGFGADEIVAFATSAVREAQNQQDFIDRVLEETGIEVRVISGPEEARLIYLGVSTGANLGNKRGLFIDIGGGSTELIVGDSHEYYSLDSLKLGSIRMTNRFLPDAKGPVSLQKFREMKTYVRVIAGHSTRQTMEKGFEVVYGGAGTITNLAQVTARRLGDNPTTLRNYVVRTSDLRDSVEMLCRIPLEERRTVPGLDPDRADIIIGGSAVIMTILEDVKAERITISDRGMRNGIIVDRLLREPEFHKTFHSVPVRKRSIMQLARACSFDEDHARYVAKLSLEMFDELKRLGFHRYGPLERELLEYGALVHDIGCFLSHTNHQRHAYYLVRHSDLLGFNDTEISIIANLAFYHRKSIPKRRHENLQGLSRATVRIITVLASILRVAEGLDRSHLCLVKSVRMVPARNPERIMLIMESEADCQLETWGVETNRDLFEVVFERALIPHVQASKEKGEDDSFQHGALLIPESRGRKN